MSPQDAIKAGQLAAYREKVRTAFRASPHATLTVRLVDSGKQVVSDNIVLDRGMLKAALDGIDLVLSRRLEKMGVSEV